VELVVRSALHKRGLRFRKHLKSLPGKPDIVFPAIKVAVFIDGDFWHGFRFPLWCHNLPLFWQKKIAINRKRDQRNFRKLRARGWRVVRLWQHQIKKDPSGCIKKILHTIEVCK
jgi:DNA mismatch endonuclease, patch repair protein